MSSGATGEASSVAPEELSSGAAEDISSLATEDISSLATEDTQQKQYDYGFVQSAFFDESVGAAHLAN